MFDPEKYARATIVARQDFATDLWSVRLRPEIELSFRPGQYVTLGLQLNGRMIERPYSIVSSPDEDTIELFIERVPEGELSAPLHDLRVGSEIAVRKRCKGLFLRDAMLPDQPLLLVATVTGVAPFVSAVRTLVRRQASGDWPAEHQVVIIQGASRADEMGYADELTGLAAEHAWFSYVATVSRPWENPEWTGETGRVEDVLRKYADRAGIAAGIGGVFLCGHPQMISNAREIMRRSGLDDKAIREEQYWPD